MNMTTITEDGSGHKRRVLALGAEIADLLRDIADRAKEFRELGVPTRDWLEVVAAALPQKGANLLFWAMPMLVEAIDLRGDKPLPPRWVHGPATTISQIKVHDEQAHTLRMRQVIDRLFAEAPKLDGGGKADPAQAPAIEVHILLRSGAPIQFSGVLSTTPEGTLRLMTPTKNGDGKPCMIEQFLDYADVTSVAVVRDVKMTEGSRIITS